MSIPYRINFRIVKLEDQLVNAKVDENLNITHNIHTGKMTVDLLIHDSKCMAKIVVTIHGTIETRTISDIRDEIREWVTAHSAELLANLMVIENGVENGTLNCLDTGGDKG